MDVPSTEQEDPKTAPGADISEPPGTGDGQVELIPCLMDSSTQDYSQKQKRQNSWTIICRELFPRWHEADAALQNKIENDIRKRWRSVKDRYNRFQTDANRSGSSPLKFKFPFHDELQFLHTSRVLRPTEGNIDCPQEPAQESSLDSEEMVLQQPPQDISSQASEESNMAATEQHENPSTGGSSVAAATSVSGIHPNTQRGKTPPPQKTTTEGEPSPDTLTNETLAMLKSTAQEDHFDNFGASIVSQWRLLNNRCKQSTCMTGICSVLAGFEEDVPFPTGGELACGIEQIFFRKQARTPIVTTTTTSATGTTSSATIPTPPAPYSFVRPSPYPDFPSTFGVRPATPYYQAQLRREVHPKNIEQNTHPITGPSQGFEAMTNLYSEDFFNL
ncbi:uncharacterized protein ACNLHF_001979 [Anomaloglossus baeobatrachus]